MYPFCKRAFDFLSSLCVLLILLPFLILIWLIVILGSPGGGFYRQTRVGKNGSEFLILKFRSMRKDADKSGKLTAGNDSRVTGFGKFLRKSKLDEVPQLLNILAGQMSVVGPRPEVPEYVRLYSDDQRKVLTVRPGLTDLATIKYIDEQKILGETQDPEKRYVEEIMPAKLKLNLEYLAKRGFFFDLGLIFKTIGKVFF